MAVKFQVFKKSSPNAKITLYLTKRDYVDHVTHVDPIEGVLLLDPNYVQERKVFLQLVLRFRFGREDDESMGYNFLKTLYFDRTQIYPPPPPSGAATGGGPTTSDVQRNLIAKLGNFAFPFKLDFPRLSSPSYVMMQGWEDKGALMGIEFEVMSYVGVDERDVHKRSSCNLMIRRLMECPANFFDLPAPRGTSMKTFLTCFGTVTLQASLTSSVYFPEEDIPVKVTVKNDTSRDIKRIKVKVVQLSEVPIFSYSQVREKTLLKVDDPVSLGPGGSLNRDYMMMAVIPSKTARGQVFLQGELRSDASPTLAPSTILHPDVGKGDVFGVYVSYIIRVKATLGTLTGDAILDVPFVLAVQQGCRFWIKRIYGIPESVLFPHKFQKAY